MPTGVLAFDAKARADFLSAWEEKKDEAERITISWGEPFPAGFYVDENGDLNCDVPTVLRAQGIEPTPENVEQASQLLATQARLLLPAYAEVEVEE